MGRSMNGLLIVGALLALLGIAGLAMPVFTTSQTSEVAKIGDLRVESVPGDTRFQVRLPIQAPAHVEGT